MAARVQFQPLGAILAAGDADAAGQVWIWADITKGLAEQQTAGIKLQDPLRPWVDMADQTLAIQQDPADCGGIHPAQQLPGWGQGPG